MSEYGTSRASKLRLKGVSQSVKKKSKRKQNKIEAGERVVNIISKEAREEAKCNGGWWIVDAFDKIPTGLVAFQHDSGRYMMATEGGALALSAEHPAPGSGPSQQEIFTLFKVNDTKYALKTYTGKFVGVNARGEVFASSDAVGQREQFDLAIESGKVALQASTSYFLSYSHSCYTASSTAAKSADEIFTMRTNHTFKVKKATSIDDQLDPRACELNYVKQFQSFGYKKASINGEDITHLVDAKEQGRFHESMLDRREKMKSDRYCK